MDDLALATHGDVPARQLLLVDVSLEVTVDAGETVGGEAGFGGVDLDLQCGHAPSMPESVRRRRAVLERRRSSGRSLGCVYGVGMTDLPSPSDPASVPPPPAAPFAGTLGPIGKPRSAWLVILLTIVTFGIWTIVWSYQNGEEIKQHARTGLGGVAYLFITLLISPITMFLMASEVEQLYRREGKEPPITTIWGLWFLLPIIGNFIWFFRIQRSINDYWTSHGSTVSPGL